jgi:hypothetical protein
MLPWAFFFALGGCVKTPPAPARECSFWKRSPPGGLRSMMVIHFFGISCHDCLFLFCFWFVVGAAVSVSLSFANADQELGLSEVPQGASESQNFSNSYDKTNDFARPPFRNNWSPRFPPGSPCPPEEDLPKAPQATQGSPYSNQGPPGIPRAAPWTHKSPTKPPQKAPKDTGRNPQVTQGNPQGPPRLPKGSKNIKRTFPISKLQN